MKIAVISKKDIRGGAARAAARLFQGLCSIEPQVYMLVKKKESHERNIIPIIIDSKEYKNDERKLLDLEEKHIKQNRTPISDSAFTIPYPGCNLAQSAFLKDMDIINIHNLKNFQSVETITGLLKLGKPVIWTLHDQSAFTGGCHFTAGCRGYRRDCRHCPQLADNDLQIPAQVLKNKLKNWSGYKNLTIVTPSLWLAECADESKVFKHTRIEHIFNSLETDIFKPYPKPEAKQRLGINPEAVVILFGAMNLTSKRKGFNCFKEAIDYCRENREFKQALDKGEICPAAFGKSKLNPTEQDFLIHYFGEVKSQEEMALIYSAADIFVLPSLEDNLPNSMLEALACGTPVIAFSVGGIPEVIEHGKTGCLVPIGNSERMASYITELVYDKTAREKMGKRGASLMRREFNLAVQAQNYLELFAALTKKKKSRSVPGDKNPPAHPGVAPEQIVLEDKRSAIDPDFYSGLKDVFLEFGINPPVRPGKDTRGRT
ncbi:MAG: glycosyltransferase [Candidatus Aminicenantes bacterium]|nr:glycosyltransferase [Candidatus Aminicenantes bacterium]